MDESPMTHFNTKSISVPKPAGHTVNEAASMSELYEQYVGLIYNYLFSRVQNTAEAEDLTSQTFLSAVESRRTVRNPQKFRSWLFTIARNKANDHFRRAKRWPTSELAGDWEEHIEDGVENGDRDELITLRRLIRRLGSEEQQIVHLRISAGLTFGEIAAVLGGSENRVKKIYYKVLERLQAQVEG